MLTEVRHLILKVTLRQVREEKCCFKRLIIASAPRLSRKELIQKALRICNK